MINTELYNVLTEAAQVLSRDIDNDFILTEAAGDSEASKITKDVKDAINKQDEKKLRKAISDFKKWFFTADPEGNHEKLRTTLHIIYILLTMVVSMAAFWFTYYTAILHGANYALYKKVNIKWLIATLVSLGTALLTFKSIDLYGNAADKVQAETIDEFIEKYEKKVDELKKSVESFEGDKTTKEYKAISKSYVEAVQWLDWFKGRKEHFIKKKNIDDTKQELKEAKKSKDKQKIAEAKAKYNAAKSLIESALELLSDEDIND